MWRRPLNSIPNHYRLQKAREDAWQDTYLSAGLDDEQVYDENGLENSI